MKKYKKKNPSKNSIDELMGELKNPHTREEYEEIHRRIKRILRKDFIKGIAVPFILFVNSITVLIMQLLK